jgi:hypothetical protein
MTKLQSVDSPRTMTTRMGPPRRPRFESARHISVVIEADDPLPAGADHKIECTLDEFDRSQVAETDAAKLFAVNDALRAATGGAFDPVAGSGTAGAGHLIDTITAVLHRCGADDFVVDVDGAMRHSGTTGLHVALRHPDNHDLAIGVTTLADQALCAAAHAADADVTAAWVVADDAVTANALCDALLVVAPQRLSRFFRFSYVRLLHDGHAEVSRNFPGAVFVQP